MNAEELHRVWMDYLKEHGRYPANDQNPPSEESPENGKSWLEALELRGKMLEERKQ